LSGPAPQMKRVSINEKRAEGAKTEPSTRTGR
jgi:hypothetical protein